VRGGGQERATVRALLAELSAAVSAR
jgi:hypothetical protein